MFNTLKRIYLERTEKYLDLIKIKRINRKKVRVENKFIKIIKDADSVDLNIYLKLK